MKLGAFIFTLVLLAINVTLYLHTDRHFIGGVALGLFGTVLSGLSWLSERK